MDYSDIDSLSKDEQIAKLKEIIDQKNKTIQQLESQNKDHSSSINNFEEVVKRVRGIIKESRHQFTENTPIAELKEALILQSTTNGKQRDQVEKQIDRVMEQAQRDPTVKKGLIAQLNSEINSGLLPNRTN